MSSSLHRDSALAITRRVRLTASRGAHLHHHHEPTGNRSGVPQSTPGLGRSSDYRLPFPTVTLSRHLPRFVTTSVAHVGPVCLHFRLPPPPPTPWEENSRNEPPDVSLPSRHRRAPVWRLVLERRDDDLLHLPVLVASGTVPSLLGGPTLLEPSTLWGSRLGWLYFVQFGFSAIHLKAPARLLEVDRCVPVFGWFSVIALSYSATVWRRTSLNVVLEARPKSVTTTLVQPLKPIGRQTC